MTVRGIDVSSRFFWEVALPVFESEFPSYIDRIAVGLVAAGSDCAGNDDGVSRDFDWGPRLQAFLTEQDFNEIGADVQSALDGLPNIFHGTCCRPSGLHSSTVYYIDSFFIKNTFNPALNIGFSHAPQSAADWLRIPEYRLFDLAHGQVFYDPIGEFTERRKEFMAYYPNDAWKRLIFAALRDCSEYGERLLPRSIAHDDYYTAQIAWWNFSESILKLGFLLNRCYAPRKQWLYREFCKLPLDSSRVVDLLWDGQNDIVPKIDLVGRIAAIYGRRLHQFGLIRKTPNGSPGSFDLWSSDIHYT